MSRIVAWAALAGAPRSLPPLATQLADVFGASMGQQVGRRPQQRGRIATRSRHPPIRTLRCVAHAGLARPRVRTRSPGRGVRCGRFHQWCADHVTDWSPGRVRPVLTLLAGRWVPYILAELAEGELRRVELRRRLEGVSDKSLTDSLGRLVDAGWVDRRFTAGVPAQVDYSLTEAARDLFPILTLVQAWAEENPDPAA